MEVDAALAPATGEGQNRLLRRIDWRFLLPDPNPRRTACFAGDRLSQALRLVSQEVVSLLEAQQESCDLAVVSNPAAKSLLKAFTSLCPEGMLYGEWYSPLAGGPPAIEKRLAQAGFEKIAFYWPWPWPQAGSTIFWLPLGAPKALDYFLKTRPPSKNIRQEIIRSLMRLAWKVARGVNLLVPVCVIARKPAEASPAQGEPGRRTDRPVQGSLGDWNPGCLPESLYWLMLTGGLSRMNKVVRFGFNPEEALPCLVVKHARVPDSIPALVREAQNLERVANLPGGGPANVPRLLFVEGSNQTAAVGESVVTGDPLYTHLGKDNYRSWALQATAWLGQLVKPEPIVPRSDWWARVAGPALDSFDRRYGRELGGWADRIRDHLLSLTSLPVAFEHRDFSPWNVLVTDEGQLAVLDWEGGEPRGIPGLDLIYFLTFLAFFIDGAMESGNFRSAYRIAQDPGSFAGSVQAECLQIYFQDLGIDPGFARPLRTLAWTIHSLSVFPRLGPRGNQGSECERGLFIQLLAEEMEG